MRHRIILSALVLATAAACGTVTESPTAPPRLAPKATFDEGPPPPPPIDTGDVQLDGETSGGFRFDYFSARYFVNKTETVAWITFESGYNSALDKTVTATPNARLLYNQRAGTTNGTGILTDENGTRLDLSTVVIDKPTSDFGACDGTNTMPFPAVTTRDEVVIASTTDGPTRSPNFCGGANFVGGGYLTVTRRVAGR